MTPNAYLANFDVRGAERHPALTTGGAAWNGEPQQQVELGADTVLVMSTRDGAWIGSQLRISLGRSAAPAELQLQHDAVAAAFAAAMPLAPAQDIDAILQEFRIGDPSATEPAQMSGSITRRGLAFTVNAARSGDTRTVSVLATVSPA